MHLETITLGLSPVFSENWRFCQIVAKHIREFIFSCHF